MFEFFIRYPNVMYSIFGQLDSVSLLRSKQVCQRWSEIVETVVKRKEAKLRRKLLSGSDKSVWSTSNCSIQPLYPKSERGSRSGR